MNIKVSDMNTDNIPTIDSTFAGKDQYYASEVEMNADEIVKALRWYAKVTTYCEDNIVNCRECEFHGFCTDPYSDDGIAMMRERLEQAADTIESLQAQLAASQRRERAHEAAIKRHYADMTSQCFICYSCANHDARQKAKWDGKKPEDYACSGCGDGKPNWKFDVERFMGQEGTK